MKFPLAHEPIRITWASLRRIKQVHGMHKVTVNGHFRNKPICLSKEEVQWLSG